MPDQKCAHAALPHTVTEDANAPTAPCAERRRLLLLLGLLPAVLLGLPGCGLFRSSEKSTLTGTYKPYTVRGKTYYPLTSAENFREEGLASWYGKDFHGRSTANGEIYNMHAMTAAHKILPMQTQVRVTNLENGKQVTLRINDRGPFVQGRVIDVSYKAAQHLDILGKGVARVRVESVGGVPGYTPGGDLPGRFYVQIGAFTVRENAQALLQAVRSQFPGTRIQEAMVGRQRFWRVQVGTFDGLKAAENRQRQLQRQYPAGFVIAD